MLDRDGQKVDGAEMREFLRRGWYRSHSGVNFGKIRIVLHSATASTAAQALTETRNNSRSKLKHYKLNKNLLIENKIVG